MFLKPSKFSIIFPKEPYSSKDTFMREFYAIYQIDFFNNFRHPSELTLFSEYQDCI